MRALTFLALAAALALVAVAPSSGAPKREAPDGFGAGPPHLPPVTYIIRAVVVPDSLLVRGTIDIDYRNSSFDTLQTICFALLLNDTLLTADSSGPPYCRIDSLLYRGQPLTGQNLASRGTIIEARLPGGIPPQGSGAFFLSFESHLSPDNRFDKGNGIQLLRWYPEICDRVDTSWYLPLHYWDDSTIREFADYDLELHVDSSWSAAFPGELINDKEHFGLVPPPEDTMVQEDILKNFSRIPGGQPYRLVFDGGVKKYYISSRNEAGFPLVLHRNLIFDRAVADSVRVQAAYGQRQRKRWHIAIAAEAARFLRAFSDSLGRPPRDRVTIAPATLRTPSGNDGSLILLPCDNKNRDLLRQMLAVRIARLWFARPIPGAEPAGRVLDEGLGCFVAMSLGARSHSKNLYYNLHDYRNWRDDLNHDDSAATELATRTIPGWLEICRAVTSDSIVWGALRDYAASFPYRHPSPDTLAGFLQSLAGLVHVPTLDEAAWLLDSLDMVVGKASFKKTAQGYSVSCEVFQNGPIDLPIQVGYVDMQKDTLYTAVTVRAHPAGGEATTVDYLSARPIYAVVVDPNHRLPDYNRNNNYRLAHLTRFRYETPRSLFPAYQHR